MIEDINQIREEAIKYIKEKVNRNPKYLHPCNKERLEDMKKLKFANGYEFTCWMQNNGIMMRIADIKRRELQNCIKNANCTTDKEYRDRNSQRLGFQNYRERNREYTREWRHDTGRCLSKEDNIHCSAHFGEFTENLMIQTFEDPIKMSYGNPGFDWICKTGDKIDNKGVCLTYPVRGSPRWSFNIKWNDKADWFVLSCWDNRDSLNPLHVLIFHKNDIVRERKFWMRDSFSITPEGFREFEKFEYTNRLEKIKELCYKNKENIS